jgi:hypothetical protein
MNQWLNWLYKAFLCNSDNQCFRFLDLDLRFSFANNVPNSDASVLQIVNYFDHFGYSDYFTLILASKIAKTNNYNWPSKTFQKFCEFSDQFHEFLNLPRVFGPWNRVSVSGIGFRRLSETGQFRIGKDSWKNLCFAGNYCLTLPSFSCFRLTFNQFVLSNYHNCIFEIIIILWKDNCNNRGLKFAENRVNWFST